MQKKIKILNYNIYKPNFVNYNGTFDLGAASLQIQGGSDKSGFFFFLLSNDTAQLKIIRFD
jgi:hypothetical protein